MKSILLDEKGDLSFKNGKLQFGNTKDQNAQLILATNKGNWKEDPLLGANLTSLIASKSGMSRMKQSIKTALGRDGIETRSIAFKDGLINLLLE